MELSGIEQSWPFEWYEGAMVLRIFFFLFFLVTTSGKKEHLHETIFVTVTVITVFRKSYSESYLISAMFKVLFEHFWDKLTMLFERYLAAADSAGMDQHTC